MLFFDNCAIRSEPSITEQFKWTVFASCYWRGGSQYGRNQLVVSRFPSILFINSSFLYFY